MKIETISVMQRKNLGNYEHIEISASARLEDNEDPSTALLKLKESVQNALEGIHTIRPASEVKPEPEPVVEEPVKEKKTRAKKEKPVEVQQEVPPVIEPETKVNLVAYDSTNTEHKSILAGYLSKKYDSAWKTVAPAEEIKKFTSSLNGQPFLDDTGAIVPVFLEQIHTFFGA